MRTERRLHFASTLRELGGAHHRRCAATPTDRVDGSVALARVRVGAVSLRPAIARISDTLGATSGCKGPVKDSRGGSAERRPLSLVSRRGILRSDDHDDELGPHPAILRIPNVDVSSESSRGNSESNHEGRFSAPRETMECPACGLALVRQRPRGTGSAGGGTRNGQYSYVRPLPAGGRGALSHRA